MLAHGSGDRVNHITFNPKTKGESHVNIPTILTYPIWLYLYVPGAGPDHRRGTGKEITPTPPVGYRGFKS